MYYVDVFAQGAESLMLLSSQQFPELYAALWRESSDMLFALRVTPTGLVFDAINPAMEASTGLSILNVTGRSLEEVLPIEWAQRLAIRCTECLRQGKPVRHIEALPLPSGRWHWETTLTPTWTSDGAAQLILGSAREVNENFEAQITDLRGSDCEFVDPEIAPTIHFTALPNGRPDRLSPSFFEYTGLVSRTNSAQLSGVVHPDDLEKLLPDGDETPQDGVYMADVRLRRRDGAYRTFRLRAELIDGLSGRRWYGIAADVCRLDIPDQLSSRKIENLLRDVSGCSVLLDRNWRISGISPQAAAWFGHIDSELLGWDLRERIPMEPALVDAIATALQTNDPATLELPAVLQPHRWLQFEIYPAADEVFVLFCDVTERRRAEAAVEPSRELLQGLSDFSAAETAVHKRAEDLLFAQDEERQRIAIELHDSTMQHLVVLDMGVVRLRRLLRNEGGAGDVLKDMSNAAQEALKEIRVLSYVMKPQEGVTLESLVRQFVQGFGRRADLNTSFRAQGPVNAVSAAVQHAAFRIVQASMSNVYRHAEARGVEVELTSRASVLTVRIADDGKGMPPLHGEGAEGVSLGVGITGMQTRVNQLGGKLTVGGDGAGTVVTATFPAIANAVAGEPAGTGRARTRSWDSRGNS